MARSPALSLLNQPADAGLLELLPPAARPPSLCPAALSSHPARGPPSQRLPAAVQPAYPPGLRASESKSDPETWAHLKQLGDFLHLSYIWFHFLEPVFLLIFSNPKSILFDEATKSKSEVDARFSRFHSSLWHHPPSPHCRFLLWCNFFKGGLLTLSSVFCHHFRVFLVSYFPFNTM